MTEIRNNAESEEIARRNFDAAVFCLAEAIYDSEPKPPGPPCAPFGSSIFPRWVIDSYRKKALEKIAKHVERMS